MSSGDIWSYIETKAFLTTYGKYYHQLQNAKTNNEKGTLWDKVALNIQRLMHYEIKELSGILTLRRGWNLLNQEFSQDRWLYLIKRYKNFRDHMNRTGNNPVSFDYEQEMDNIIDDNPTIHAHVTIDSMHVCKKNSDANACEGNDNKSVPDVMESDNTNNKKYEHQNDSKKSDKHKTRHKRRRQN